MSSAHIKVVRLEGLSESATLIRCCVNKVASNSIWTKEAASEGHNARGEHDATTPQARISQCKSKLHSRVPTLGRNYLLHLIYRNFVMSIFSFRQVGESRRQENDNTGSTNSFRRNYIVTCLGPYLKHECLPKIYISFYVTKNHYHMFALNTMCN